MTQRLGRDSESCSRVRLVLAERLMVEQRLSEGVELIAMLAEKQPDFCVRVVDQAMHLLVDQVLQAQAPLRLARGVRDPRASPRSDRRLHRQLPRPAALSLNYRTPREVAATWNDYDQPLKQAA